MNQPTARTVGPNEWFYALNGNTQEPVAAEHLRRMLELRQIPPHTPVWRPGMTDWVPANSVPDLVAGLAISPAELMSPRQRKEARIVKNAKVNAIVMFALFLLGMLATGHSIASRSFRHTLMIGLPGTAVVVAELFALIYVPLRWRVLRSLPSPYNTLGLIGGLGLCGLLGLLALAIALDAVVL